MNLAIPMARESGEAATIPAKDPTITIRNEETLTNKDSGFPETITLRTRRTIPPINPPIVAISINYYSSFLNEPISFLYSTILSKTVG